MQYCGNQRVLGGITLALVLGDVVGIYAAKHRLGLPVEPSMIVESASDGVAKAARNFHPDGAAMPVAVARNEHSAARYDAGASGPPPMSRLRANAPIIEDSLKDPAPAEALYVKLRSAMAVSMAPDRPIRRAVNSVSAAIARDIIPAKASTHGASAANFARSFPQPDFSFDRAGASDPAPVAAVEAPALSLASPESAPTAGQAADNDGGDGLDGSVKAQSSELPAESQSAPVSPASSSPEGQLPAA